MDFLSKVRESPNYERLRTSVEAKAVLKDICIYGSILFFTTILTVYAFFADRSQMSTSFLIISAIMLCLLGYHLHSFAAIFSHPDSYQFVQVQLSQVWLDRGRVHCWTVLTDPQGNECKVKVGSMLPVGGWDKNAYLYQSALAAFNNRTGRAVLIALLPN